jgi:hypothetical protein
MENKSPHNRTITVKVKASELFTKPPIPLYVNPNTVLIDDEGLANAYGDNNRNYSTEVYLGYNVTWNIVVADPDGADKGFDVKLESISQERGAGNANFFGTPEIKSNDGGKTIVGTIVNLPPLRDMEDFYDIYFGISNDGGRSYDYFPLDPRLKINQ